MSKCKECGKGFSCGCQKTSAADGSLVHKTCLTAYNSKNKKTGFNSNLSKNIQIARKNGIRRN